MAGQRLASYTLVSLVFGPLWAIHGALAAPPPPASTPHQPSARTSLVSRCFALRGVGASALIEKFPALKTPLANTKAALEAFRKSLDEGVFSAFLDAFDDKDVGALILAENIAAGAGGFGGRVFNDKSEFASLAQRELAKKVLKTHHELLIETSKHVLVDKVALGSTYNLGMFFGALHPENSSLLDSVANALGGDGCACKSSVTVADLDSQNLLLSGNPVKTQPAAVGTRHDGDGRGIYGAVPWEVYTISVLETVARGGVLTTSGGAAAELEFVPTGVKVSTPKKSVVVDLFGMNVGFGDQIPIRGLNDGIDGSTPEYVNVNKFISTPRTDLTIPAALLFGSGGTTMAALRESLRQGAEKVVIVGANTYGAMLGMLAGGIGENIAFTGMHKIVQAVKSYPGGHEKALKEPLPAETTFYASYGGKTSEVIFLNVNEYYNETASVSLNGAGEKVFEIKGVRVKLPANAPIVNSQAQQLTPSQTESLRRVVADSKVYGIGTAADNVQAILLAKNDSTGGIVVAGSSLAKLGGTVPSPLIKDDAKRAPFTDAMRKFFQKQGNLKIFVNDKGQLRLDVNDDARGPDGDRRKPIFELEVPAPGISFGLEGLGMMGKNIKFFVWEDNQWVKTDRENVETKFTLPDPTKANEIGRD